MADWSWFPQELQALVFHFLDFESLYQCLTVNKRWYAAAMDDLLWKDRFLQYFAVSSEESAAAEEEQGEHAPRSWLERFKHYALLKFCFHPLLTNSVYMLSQGCTKAVRDMHKGCCPKLILSTQLQCKKEGGFTACLDPSSPSVEGQQKNHETYAHYYDLPDEAKEQRVQGELQENRAMFTRWEGKKVLLEFEVLKKWEVGLFHDVKSFRRFSTTHYFCYTDGLKNSYNCTMISMFENTIVHSKIKDGEDYQPDKCHFNNDLLADYLATAPTNASTFAQQRKDFGKFLQLESKNISYPSKPEDRHTITVEVDGGPAKQVTFSINGTAYDPVPLPLEPFVMAFNTGYSGAEITLTKQAVTLL
ncbi:hypothetical protein QOT17_000155 [Balamuthia mandrillaris]